MEFPITERKYIKVIVWVLPDHGCQVTEEQKLSPLHNMLEIHHIKQLLLVYVYPLPLSTSSAVQTIPCHVPGDIINVN